MNRWVFLSGMMGTGKSTVGRALAARLGARFVDLDARIAEREGRSIAELFASRGEAAFRELEAHEAELLLASEQPAVVALGGGTVTNARTRRRLLREGLLVTLTAPAGELIRRLEGATDRPLLARNDAARVIAELLEERAEAYAECHGTVATQGRTPEAVAEEVERIVRAAPIVVPLGRRTYRVEVGRGLLTSLGPRLDELARGAVVVVTDENVREAWAAPFASSIERKPVVLVALEPGEEHKTIASVERIWDAALDAGIDRSALVVGVGGGVVTDLAGFAASTLLRGIDVVQVPTSLLAMVDASVGGKTGFDRARGKNLVGTFHQPRLVVCDVAALDTLPEAELRAGLAEVVKAAWIDGEQAVVRLEQDAERLLAREAAAFEHAVRQSVRLKAEVVASDEHESGRRMVLNLGHTIGHAIEASRGYRGIRHGEAVALGMIAAHRVAGALGDARAGERLERTRALLIRLGLPVDLDAWIDADVLAFVGSDKKRASGKVRFVVPHEPGEVEIVPLSLQELGRALGVA